jgi:hypothetical protein
MTPKVQVGTILIEEWSLVRQRRCCENNLLSRTKAVISVNFSAYGEQRFNKLQTNFVGEIP